jgi:uncharacterized integral membrane protein
VSSSESPPPATPSNGHAGRPNADRPATPGEPLATETAPPSAETAGARRARHARRSGLYVELVTVPALVVLLVALALANTRRVELDWLVGTTRASLIWIVLVTAIASWVIGILTAGIVRRRTRRKQDG